MKRVLDFLKNNYIEIIFVFLIILFKIINIYNNFYISLFMFLLSSIETIINKKSIRNILVILLLFITINNVIVVKDILLMFGFVIVGFIMGKSINNIFNIKIKYNSKIFDYIHFCLPIFITVIFESFYSLCNYNTFSYNNIFISIILVYMLWLVILSISNTRIANIIISILFYILFIANQIKIYFTGIAISYNDLVLYNEAGEIVTIIKNNFKDAIVFYNKYFILLTILFIFINILFNKNKFKIKKVYLRLICLMFSILLIFISYNPSKKFNDYLIKNYYKTYNSKKSKIKLNDYYNDNKILAGVYGKYLQDIDYTENIKSKKELNNIYNKFEYKEEDKNLNKPNIIVMFSESFWDITLQNSFTFDKDPLFEYHEMEKEGIVFQTLSPSFGGSSSNVEFEFLTGGNMLALPEGSYAYKNYYNNYFKNKNKNNPSIIEELTNNGYKTEILNAYSKDLYDCNKVYDYMNVSKHTHLFDELGYYPTDDYLANKIIETFNNKDKDDKLFYMAITMEAHTPYDFNKYKKYDFEITSSKNFKDKTIYTYTQAIRNSSLALKKVYDYIKTIDEETIIVFYGDHLPYLGNGNNAILNQMDYFKTENDLEKEFLEHNVKTLVLSNYDISLDNSKIMSNDMISATLLNNMNIEISDYYKWLYSIKEILPASNKQISIDSNNNIYYNDNLPKDLKDIFEQRYKVQKYLFK